MNSYREPTATWLGSPNFSPNRDGHYIAAEDGIPGLGASFIVLHTMVGTVASANARFQNAAQQASAHYGIGYNGSKVQWVDEKDAAWHAGDYNVNLDSIGIEHEDMGNYNSPRPDALYKASAILIAQICKRYKLPCQRGDKAAGRSGCIDHRTVYATACPDSLDTNRLIRDAAAYLKFLNGQGPNPYAAPPVGWKVSQTVKPKAGSFIVYEASAVLSERYANAAVVAQLAKGAAIVVDGYSYAIPPVIAADLTGDGQPGDDYLWWHAIAPKVGWVTDAVVDTSGAAGLPQNTKYDDLPPVAPVVPVYAAVSPEGVTIATDVLQAAVVAKAQAWQQLNRGKVVNITKAGVVVQTLLAVPPEPQPEPQPQPTPQPTPGSDAPSPPGGWVQFREWLKALIKWITG